MGQWQPGADCPDQWQGDPGRPVVCATNHSPASNNDWSSSRRPSPAVTAVLELRRHSQQQANDTTSTNGREQASESGAVEEEWRGGGAVEEQWRSGGVGDKEIDGRMEGVGEEHYCVRWKGG